MPNHRYKTRNTLFRNIKANSITKNMSSYIAEDQNRMLGQIYGDEILLKSGVKVEVYLGCLMMKSFTMQIIQSQKQISQ